MTQDEWRKLWFSSGHYKWMSMMAFQDAIMLGVLVVNEEN